MPKIYSSLILLIFFAALPFSVRAGCCSVNWSCVNNTSKKVISKDTYRTNWKDTRDCDAVTASASVVLTAFNVTLNTFLEKNLCTCGMSSVIYSDDDCQGTLNRYPVYKDAKSVLPGQATDDSCGVAKIAAKVGCCKSSWRCGGANGSSPEFKGDYLVPAGAASECTDADNQLSGVLAARVKELNETLTNNRCACTVVTKSVYETVTCYQSSITPFSSMVSTSSNDNDKCGVVKSSSESSGSPSVQKSSRTTYKELPNPLASYAQDIADLPKIIGNIIKSIMGIIGAVALLVFVYGGFVWMTAAGNETNIAKGKKILLWASIALIIMVLGWVLIGFIFEALGV